LAAGLQPDPDAFAAGRKDGEQGASFRLLDFDAYSYALGFQRGNQLLKSREQRDAAART
jgi:hypothetical protein